MSHTNAPRHPDNPHPADASSSGSNQSGMRAYNEQLVLTLIRQAGSMPKAEIARVTGLSAQTVSVIVRALETEALLAKGEPQRGKVGQPSVPMALNPDGAFFLGLKVGRRSTELMLTDFLGGVRYLTQQTHPAPTPNPTVSFTNTAIEAALDSLPEDLRKRVAGLGIALPYRLWDWTPSDGATAADLEAWRNFDLGAAIAASWDFPVFVCNDASAACGAELVFGEQDRPRDFLYFYIGAFAGGGLVLDNTLFTGRSGNAAAVGSLPVLMPDGSTQQLVDVASLVNLEASLQAQGVDATAIWDNTEIWPLPSGALGSWLDTASHGLARAIVSATCVIDFACVLIDGAIPAEVRSQLVQRTQERLGALTVPGIKAPEIRDGSIGGAARSLGAASLPLSERYLVDRNAFLLKG